VKKKALGALIQDKEEIEKKEKQLEEGGALKIKDLQAKTDRLLKALDEETIAAEVIRTSIPELTKEQREQVGTVLDSHLKKRRS